MRKTFIQLMIVCPLLVVANANAQEVKTYYDQYQNVVADVAIGYRYDKPDEVSKDSVYMTYMEGGQFPGYDDVLFVLAYDADVDPSSGESPGSVACIIKRDSPLYEPALDFLLHFNGASTFRVSAQAGVFSECLSFQGGADSTRSSQLQRAWQPFWLYDYQTDVTGALVKRFQGSFTPYVLSNGIMVRGMKIQYSTKQYPEQADTIELTAFDKSGVGEGPVFASDFYCAVDASSPVFHIYKKLVNAPSRHLVFNVQHYANSEKCHTLSLVLNSQSFELD